MTTLAQELQQTVSNLRTNGSNSNASETPELRLSKPNYVNYGIPARFAIDTPPQLVNDNRAGISVIRESIAKIRRGDHPKRGLLIIGERGTGKTTWMSEIAKAACDRYESIEAANKRLESHVYSETLKRTVRNPNIKATRKPQFITFWDFIADLRKSFSTGTRYAEELTTASYIFIDDLGKVQTQRDWFIEAFQEVIDRIYNDIPGHKLLYITSNMTGDEITATFGEACKDRIDALCYTVTINGRSLRD